MGGSQRNASSYGEGWDTTLLDPPDFGMKQPVGGRLGEQQPINQLLMRDLKVRKGGDGRLAGGGRL